MKATIKSIIADLKNSARSCEQEASGELTGDRSEGLTCIADNLHVAARQLRRACLLTPTQRADLIELAGNAQRDDLIAALSKE